MTSLQGSTLPYLNYVPIYVKLTNLWPSIGFPFLLMLQRELCMTMARYPSVKAVTFDTAASEYGAPYLRSALARFIALRRYPDIC